MGVSSLVRVFIFLNRHMLLFNKFEVGVLNHLLIVHSQLHMVNWAYVEVFQY